MKTSFLQKPWLLLAGTSLVVACATVGAQLAPELADRLKIPHGKHGEATVTCDTCHEKVATSTSLAMSLIPGMDKCGECHDVADDKTCNMCHTRPDSPEARTRPNRHLNFPHKRHLEDPDIKGDCARCHQVLPEPETPADMVLGPPMAVCTSCHNHAEDYQEARCSLCHQELTLFQLGPTAAAAGRSPTALTIRGWSTADAGSLDAGVALVGDFSHRGDFLKGHALPGRSTVVCAQCHDQTFCADCHAKTEAARAEVKFPARVDRQFIHRNDWLSRHTVEARADEARCQRCHGVSYCQACHASQGLSSQGATTLKPHPPGFGGAGPNTHGPAARRDIVACAACHDQGAGSICVDCHKVGGVGGNPHPATWLTRHNSDELKRNSMCLACHP